MPGRHFELTHHSLMNLMATGSQFTVKIDESINWSIDRSVNQWNRSIDWSNVQWIDSLMYRSIDRWIDQSINPLMILLIHWLIEWSIDGSIDQSIHQSTGQSIYPWIHQSIDPSIEDQYRSIDPSIDPSIQRSIAPGSSWSLLVAPGRSSTSQNCLEI